MDTERQFLESEFAIHIMHAMQEAVEDGASKQENPSLTSIKQEAPDANAAGAAAGNKVVDSKYTVMSAAHLLTSLTIAPSCRSIAFCNLDFREGWQLK